MGTRKSCSFAQFTFPRKDADGKPINKVGWVKKDKIEAVEPGTKDDYTHLHLSCGAELIVLEPVSAFLPE